MNHLTFIQTIRKGAASGPDRYGWVTADIGRYRIRTNGTEWTAIVIGSNNVVTRLQVVIDEYQRIRNAKATADR
jgi:hypothetical protein